MRPFLTAGPRSELLTMGFGAVAFLPLEGVIRLGRTTAALFQQRRDCAGQSPTSNMLPSQEKCQTDSAAARCNIYTLLFFSCSLHYGVFRWAPGARYEMSDPVQRCQISSTPLHLGLLSLWSKLASPLSSVSRGLAESARRS